MDNKQSLTSGSGSSGLQGIVDWKKMVYLNPPNAVIFREAKEDGKSASQIEINNKSKDYIMFKVKTTEPNNYIVRPNQGVIKPEDFISVKIIC